MGLGGYSHVRKYGAMVQHWNVMQKIVRRFEPARIYFFFRLQKATLVLSHVTLECFLYNTISSSVPFTPTIVQVSNLTLVETKMDYSASSPNLYLGNVESNGPALKKPVFSDNHAAQISTGKCWVQWASPNKTGFADSHYLWNVEPNRPALIKTG